MLHKVGKIVLQHIMHLDQFQMLLYLLIFYLIETLPQQMIFHSVA